MTCLDTIPAYYRKRFNHHPGDIAMLKLHDHNPAAMRPEHTSAAWVAHNAAMQEKRDILLGKGQPPVIGMAYTPKLDVMPALYVPKPSVEWPGMGRIVKDVLMLVGFVSTMSVIYHIGAAVL